MNSQVEQVDREAVAKLLGGAAPEGLLSGSKDTLSVVQAFARHRLASLASQPPVLDEREGVTLSPDPVLLGEVRQALEPFAKIGSEIVHGQTGYVKITTCAEYFHGARALLAKLPKLTGEEV